MLLTTQNHHNTNTLTKTSAQSFCPLGVPSLKVFSPAKLNLFLHITGKRKDGYHNIQSVLCRLDFGDTLHFYPSHQPHPNHHSPQKTPPITLTGAETLTDNPLDNLIVKAAHLLYHYAQTNRIGSPYPISIDLTKRIPTGAGLGGGSSNAGLTLLTLNTLWQLHLDLPTLLDLAVQLGADVPFFVFNHPAAIATGIGEQLRPITLPKRQFLLLFPQSHNATAQFFCHPLLKKDTPIYKQLDSTLFLDNLHPNFYNAFEAIATTNFAIKTALDYLKQLSIITQTTPRLTGTGACVFLPLPNFLPPPNPPLSPPLNPLPNNNQTHNSPHNLTKNTLSDWQNNAPCPSIIASIL